MADQTVVRARPPRALEDVRGCLAKGNTLLFMGAGPAAALHGPDWKGLQDRLIDTLLPENLRDRCKSGGITWWRLMFLLCDTLGRRTQVENFIEEELKTVLPEPWFLNLMKAPWQFIYTTNYDDVCTRLNDLAAAKGRELRFEEHVGGRLPSKPRQRAVVKIMGDVRERAPSPGAMILTDTDRTVGPPGKPYRACLEHIRECLADGSNLVVLGQSLEDGVIQSIVTDLRSIPGSKPAGQLFFVNPRDVAWDLDILLKEMGFTQIQALAQELANSIADVEPPPEELESRTIRVAGQRISIGEPVLRYFNKAAELLDVEYHGIPCKTPRDFIMRGRYNRDALRQDWDFQRTLTRIDRPHDVATATDLVRVLRQKDSRNALIEAGPGCAKTMTALRVAHEWMTQGGVVIHVDLRVHRAGGHAVLDAVQALQQELAAAGLDPANLNPGVLVIFDNAERHHRTLHRFWATAQERKVTDFALLVTTQVADGRILESRFHSVWSLDGRLTDDEARRIPSYMAKLPHRPSEAEVKEVVQMRYLHSYWSTMYRLVEPSRSGLKESILRLVESMDAWERDLTIRAAYATVTRFPLPLSLYSVLENSKSRMEIRRAIASELVSEALMIDSRSGQDCISFMDEEQARTVVEKYYLTRPVFHVLSQSIDAIHTETEIEVLANAMHENIAVHDDDLDDFVNQILPTGEREQLVGRFATAAPSAGTIIDHGRMLRIRRLYENADQRLEEAFAWCETPAEERSVRHQQGVVALYWGSRLVQTGNMEVAAQKRDLAQKYLEDSRKRFDDVTRGLHVRFLELSADLEGETGQAQALRWRAFQEARLARVLARKEKSKNILDTAIDRLKRKLASEGVQLQDAIQLARDFRVSAGFHFLIEESLPMRWVDASAGQLQGGIDLANKLLAVMPEDPQGIESVIRLKLLRNPTDPSIAQHLEDLLATDWQVEAHVLSAYRAACLESLTGMESNLAEIRKLDPEYEIPTSRRPEFFVRNDKGTLLMPVRGGPIPWVHWGRRIGCSSFEAGELVALTVGLDGIRAVPPPVAGSAGLPAA